MTTPTPTAEGPEGSGVETGLGGTAASRGATLDATAIEVDAAGAGGCHRAEKQKREKVAGWRENLAGKSSGVGDGEGGPKNSGVAENPGGGLQGVGGGSSGQGVPHPWSGRVAPGDETSGVTLEGNRVQEAD